MSEYLNEAFQKLELLESEDFDLYDQGAIDDLKSFKDEDASTDILNIIDDAAETEDDLQDSYIGKVILECNVCHSLLYKNKDELDFSEDGSCVNEGEECPVCFSNDGFSIVGQVEPYEEVEITITDKDDETEENKEEVKESLNKHRTHRSKTRKSTKNESLIGSITGRDRAMDTLDNAVNNVGTVANTLAGKDSVLNNVGTVANTLVGKDSVLNGENGGAILKTAGSLLASDDAEKKEQCDNCEEGLLGGLNVFGGPLANNPLVSNQDKKNEAVSPDNDDIDLASPYRKNVLRKQFELNLNPYTPTHGMCMTDSECDARQKSSANWEKQREKYLSRKKKESLTTDKDFVIMNHQEEPPLSNESLKEASDLDEMSRPRGSKNTSYYSHDKVRFTPSKASSEDPEWLGLKGHTGEIVKIYGDYSGGRDRWVDLFDVKDSETGKVWTCGRTDIKKIDESLKEEYQTDYDVVDQRGKPYHLHLNDDDTVDIESEEGHSLHTDVSGTALHLLINGDCKYPLDVDEWDEWINESLKEDLNNIELDTDSQHIEIKSTPKEDNPDAEMISPISQDTMDDMMTDEEEVVPSENEEEEEMVDYPVDDFDEESFDELGESYLKKVYENVNSYKTTKVSEKDNKIFVEGLIKFKSGNTKKTSFIFEAKEADSSANVKFIGENAQITRGRKAFTVTGNLNGGKFISESLNYNYRQKNTDGQSSRVYGTVRTNR